MWGWAGPAEVAWLVWVGWAGYRWWQTRSAIRLIVAGHPETAISGRHTLDTWTAVLVDERGGVIARRHGRGTRPSCLVWRGHTYVAGTPHRADPSVCVYRVDDLHAIS